MVDIDQDLPKTLYILFERMNNNIDMSVHDPTHKYHRLYRLAPNINKTLLIFLKWLIPLFK